MDVLVDNAEMRAALTARIGELRADYEELKARRLELAHRALEASDHDPPLFVEGTSKLLDTPEFADRESLKVLLGALEEKDRLVELLGRVIDARGVQVVIGGENPVPDLSDCSLVASTYRAGPRVLGTVGIVGPKRMEYARAVALVDYLAHVLTRFLSGPDDA